MQRRSNDLSPIQVGVRVLGESEAAIHSICTVVDNLPENHVLVKHDCVNAFNLVRRDTVLELTAHNMPELYKFVLASHSCEAKLLFREHIVLSIT